MTRRTKQGLALLAGAVTLVLAWPGASTADTSLGGYSGTAEAVGVRVQVFDPVLPLPSNPQVDGSLGYAKSNTDTGPVSRGTASYFWPGDVLGDGFNQLVGNPNVKYGVQVNSRYPATSDSPAHNTAQITDGNGMYTSSDGFTTNASVTGLGIAGPGVDLLSGIGKGLNQLLGQSKPTKGSPELPVQVSGTLAGLVTFENLHSDSSVVVADKTITSTAHASLSAIKLLGGLITVSGMDITSQSVSNGTKATTTQSMKALELSVAGQNIGITDKGVEVAGSTTLLPSIPAALMSLLDKIGISVQYAPATNTVTGAAGSAGLSGLVLSIDTVPLKKALNLGGIIAPLQQMIEKIPKLGDELGPLLNLGPKIVFKIGDVSSSASAQPAFSGGVGGGTGPVTGTGGTGGTGPTSGTGGPLGTSGTNPPAQSNGNPSIAPVQSTALHLPGLGGLPRGLIIGLLLAAAAVGWGLQYMGAFLFGAGRNCVHGLSTGVPDLRKG